MVENFIINVLGANPTTFSNGFDGYRLDINAKEEWRLPAVSFSSVRKIGTPTFFKIFYEKEKYEWESKTTHRISIYLYGEKSSVDLNPKNANSEEEAIEIIKKLTTITHMPKSMTAFELWEARKEFKYKTATSSRYVSASGSGYSIKGGYYASSREYLVPANGITPLPVRLNYDGASYFWLLEKYAPKWLLETFKNDWGGFESLMEGAIEYTWLKRENILERIKDKEIGNRILNSPDCIGEENVKRLAEETKPQQKKKSKKNTKQKTRKTTALDLQDFFKNR